MKENSDDTLDSSSSDNETVKVEAGLKLALQSMGENVPDEVSKEQLEELSGKVSQGVRLRMEQKAKEQQRQNMWKGRIRLLKQAQALMQQRAYAEAAVCYEKYLRILEIVHDVQSGELTPDLFNKGGKSKELTVVTTVYWDLLRIYDTNKSYGNRMEKAASKLVLFLPLSSVFTQIIRDAHRFSRKCKHPHIVKKLLKQLRQSRGPCFIATATYGDGMHPHVVLFRYYRDQKLSKFFLGRCFISLYYKISPHLTLYVSQSPRLKWLLLCILNFIAHHLKKSP